MNKEDKKLLLKDLCARLSYKTIILFNNKHKFTLNQMNPYQYAGKDGYGVIFDFGGKVYSVEDCKPYLRPMDDMTEEEEKEYINIDNRLYSCPMDYAHIPASERIDWLNANHFNYRLPEHLYIKVTKDNNPYKK